MTKLYAVYYAIEHAPNQFWARALQGNVLPTDLPVYFDSYAFYSLTYRWVGEISADHMDMAYLMLQRDAYADPSRFPFFDERSMSVGDLFVDITPALKRRFMPDEYYMVDTTGWKLIASVPARHDHATTL